METTTKMKTLGQDQEEFCQSQAQHWDFQVVETELLYLHQALEK